MDQSTNAGQGVDLRGATIANALAGARVMELIDNQIFNH